MAFTRGAANLATHGIIPVKYSEEFVAMLETCTPELALAGISFTDKQLSQSGDIVVIPKLGSFTAATYTIDGDITYGTLPDTTVNVPVDQYQYIAYRLDYVDEKQAGNKNIFGAYAPVEAKAIRESVASYIAGKVLAGAPAGNTLAVSESYANATPTALMNAMVGLRAAFARSKGLNSGGDLEAGAIRVCVPPRVYELLERFTAAKTTLNDATNGNLRGP